MAPNLPLDTDARRRACGRPVVAGYLIRSAASKSLTMSDCDIKKGA